MPTLITYPEAKFYTHLYKYTDTRTQTAMACVGLPPAVQAQLRHGIIQDTNCAQKVNILNSIRIDENLEIIQIHICVHTLHNISTIL